jgi:hypothetical protein
MKPSYVKELAVIMRINAETARINAETAQINARNETARINARNETARIKALGNSITQGILFSSNFLLI